MPDLYVIAGCNGAGKTTGSFTALPEMLACKEFVNADIIAYGLSPFNQESVAFEAGRIMLNRMNKLLEEGAAFAFETTLASRSLTAILKKAKEYGYKITLLFFWLESPQMAKDRVTARVARGGHTIPADVIERRYYRGIKNLYELYIPVCDDWLIVNNSMAPVIIADQRNGEKKILNQSIWNMVKEQTLLAREDQGLYLSDLHVRIEKGLQKAYSKLVTESAQRNESLVVFIDGEVKHVPAKELLHTIVPA